MGNDCSRPAKSYQPYKIQLLIRDESFCLPLIPISYESLEQNVEMVAKYFFQNREPLDYYHMSYINPKTNTIIKIIDEKSYRSAIRNLNKKSLQVKIEKDSYKSMFVLNIGDSGNQYLDESVSNLVGHVSGIEDQITFLFEAYNNLLNFAEKFSVYTKSPSVKVVVTTLIFVISSSPNSAKAMVFLNSFPYIDFNLNILESEASEGAKY